MSAQNGTGWDPDEMADKIEGMAAADVDEKTIFGVHAALLRAAGDAAVEKSQNKRAADGPQVAYERLRNVARAKRLVGNAGQVPVWVLDKFRDTCASFLTGDIQRALNYEADLDTNEANLSMRFLPGNVATNVVPEINRANGTKTGNSVPVFWVWLAYHVTHNPSFLPEARKNAILRYISTMSSSNASAAKRLAWARNYDLAETGPSPTSAAPNPATSIGSPAPSVAPASTPRPPPAHPPFDMAAYASAFRSRDPPRLMYAMKTEMGMKEAGVEASTLHEAIPKEERTKAIRDALIRAAAARGEELAIKGDTPPGLFEELSERAYQLTYLGGKAESGLRTYRDAVRAWLTPGGVVDALQKEKGVTSERADLEMVDGPRGTVAMLNPDTGAPTRAVKPVSWVWHSMENSGIPGLAMNKRVEKVEAARNLDATKLAWSLHYPARVTAVPSNDASPPPASAPSPAPAPTVAAAEKTQTEVENAIASQPTPTMVSVKNLYGTTSDVRCRPPAVMADYLVEMWKTDQFAVIPRYSSAFAKCHEASGVLRSKLEDPANALTTDVRRKKIVDHVRGLRATGSPADLEVARQFRDRFAEVGLFATPEELWQLSAPPPRPADHNPPSSSADDKPLPASPAGSSALPASETTPVADVPAASPTPSAATPTTAPVAKPAKEDEDEGFWTDKTIAIAGVLAVALVLIAVFLAA
eukprot:jgi/Mesvir1/10356/Mv10557-RA.1